mmetsp:Transcript_8010/g.8597  ORF Transcript_8010/g.8597 Transcript_8010/m.8597 type:complete len:133 (-) Transcript_8010:635-1033(-)
MSDYSTVRQYLDNHSWVESDLTFFVVFGVEEYLLDLRSDEEPHKFHGYSVVAKARLVSATTIYGSLSSVSKIVPKISPTLISRGNEALTDRFRLLLFLCDVSVLGYPGDDDDDDDNFVSLFENTSESFICRQ